MPWTTIETKDGPVTVQVCTRGSRPKLCQYCRNQYVAKLCDYPVARGMSCDRGMCGNCATSVGDDLDYCPDHKHHTPPQLPLFGGNR